MFIPYILLAILVFTVSIFIAVRKRQRLKLSILILMVGISVAITTLLYPVYWDIYGVLLGLIYSILYAIKSIIGMQEISIIQTIPLNGVLKHTYYIVFYILAILSPMVVICYLLSVFSDVLDKLRLVLANFTTIHVFSDITEESVYLAETLFERNVAIVFCNSQSKNWNSSRSLNSRITTMNGIVLYQSISDIKINKNAKKVNFYLISGSQDNNIDNASEIIRKYSKCVEIKVALLVFASGNSKEMLLDAIPKGNIIVKMIDHTKYTCFNLLNSHPMYENIESKTISALIVGCGYIGKEFIKAISWCGQLSDVQLEINVIDIKAKKKEEELKRNYPELFSGKYNINFHAVNVLDNEFNHVLNKHCGKTSYTIIAMDNDDLNIDTAIYLRKYFTGAKFNEFSSKSKMCIRIKDVNKSKTLETFCDINGNPYNFISFGSYNKVFTKDVLFNSLIEKMSINFHLAYRSTLNGTESDIESALLEYYKSEYSQRSSYTCALHAKYKLFTCGINVCLSEKFSEKQIKEFKFQLEDTNTVEKLAIMEHKRWCTYMRSEGYINADISDVKTYYKLLNSYTHHIAKMHPALVEWDKLEYVSENLSEITGRKIDFKQMNYDVIYRMPDILNTTIDENGTSLNSIY